jgi:glycosyltransferase involved in cell wall biosynthesis
MAPGEQNLARPIILSANTSWYIHNFRLSLINHLQEEGFIVCIVASEDEYSNFLEKYGCRFIPITLDNKGTNPLRDSQTIFAYRSIYSSLQPSVALHFTPKPNIYGSLAARTLGILCINNIAGLGNAFIKNGLLSRIVRQMYKVSQSRAARVFFQNREDLEHFTSKRLVPKQTTELLPGSGVDTEKFAPLTKDPRSEVEGQVRFLLIARLIWDKGVGEYAEAARSLKAKYPNTEFTLLGFVDWNNPAAVPEGTIHGWEEEGILHWVGRQDDVRCFISQADCVVLPSYYREGTPRTLLEAAAMAKPLIAADSIGTREPVDDGETGFLCRPRDAHDLAEKMERIINMGRESREQMGWRGREKMIREYDENIVIEKYLKAIREITESC